MKNIQNIHPAYSVLREEFVKEVNSNIVVLLHKKSKAQIVKFENDDTNKVFTIGFRTFPSDDSGVPHILEHSVLCGSAKYPVKEPFVELLKGSLQTFLNAMTYSDKTVYPVASQNDQDYLNLMNVYLDAVFFPNIYKYPEIFAQEGWHYELENIDSELKYKGVVYNEMKGAFSSAEGLLFREIFRSLYPESTYRHESGGDPKSIVELTNQAFLDFHRKHYHPSNSFTIFYGDLDLNQELTNLEENYFSKFDYRDDAHNIVGEFDKESAATACIKNGTSIRQYPLSPDDSENGKDYVAHCFAIGDFDDSQLKFSFEILDQLLMGSEASPLKQELLKANIAKDFFSFYHDDIRWPLFAVVAKHISRNDHAKFNLLLENSLRKIAKDGFDAKLVAATINRLEFRLREADFKSYPKGLVYGLSLYKTWIYGGDPLADLRYEKHLQFVKDNIDKHYFENLIEQYLLNNRHRACVELHPVKGLQQKEDQQLKEKLQELKNKTALPEQQKIIEQTKKLLERQQRKDSEEELRSIPLLKIADVPRKATIIAQEKLKMANATLLMHPQETNDVLYYRLYLATNMVTKEQLPYLELLTSLWSKVDTKKSSYQELAQDIDLHLGGLTFSCDYFEEYKTAALRTHVEVSTKTLFSKRAEINKLVLDILGGSTFEDDQRLKELIQEIHSGMESMMIDGGHQVATLTVETGLSATGCYEDQTGGVAFYRFIKHLDEEFENLKSNVKNTLYKLQREIFSVANVDSTATVHAISVNEQSKKMATTWCKNFHEQLLQASSKEKINLVHDYNFTLAKSSQAYVIPGQVQYVSQGANYRQAGLPYSGQLRVLKTILSLDYLWNHVRVQGGAYGARVNIDRLGYLTFTSYRDPNCKETFNIYKDMSNYIRNIQLDERSLTQYILGTLAALDFPLTASMKINRAVGLYFANVSSEDLQKEREEILNCSEQKIRELAKYLDLLNQNPRYVAVGSDAKIKEAGDYFENIETLI